MTTGGVHAQVPARLNITHRGFDKYKANASTRLRLRPRAPGIETLLVRTLCCTADPACGMTARPPLPPRCRTPPAVTATRDDARSAVQGVNMMLAPIRYLQKWSATFPGEGPLLQRLPSHVDAGARRAAAQAAAARRGGVVPAGSEDATPVAVPVVPAQPLLRLSIPGLSPDVEQPPLVRPIAHRGTRWPRLARARPFFLATLHCLLSASPRGGGSAWLPAAHRRPACSWRGMPTRAVARGKGRARSAHPHGRGARGAAAGQRVQRGRRR